MKTTSFFFCLGFLCLAFGLEAQTKTFPSGQAYVLAIDGIPLRDKPDVSGKKIATLPHASLLAPKGAALSGFTSDGVAGNWRKVKYNNQEGFVFDGFLTDLPPANGTWESWDSYGIEGIELEEKKLKGVENLDLDAQGKQYDNGVTIYQHESACMSLQQWELDDRSIEEAFIWLRGCPAHQEQLRGVKLSDATVVKKDAKGKITQVLVRKKGFYLKITQKGKVTTAFMQIWCEL